MPRLRPGSLFVGFEIRGSQAVADHFQSMALVPVLVDAGECRRAAARYDHMIKVSSRSDFHHTFHMESNVCAFLSVAVRSVSGMSELQDHEAIGSAADAGTARLDEILEEFAAVVADSTPVADAARIDRIARLERLRAVTAALQVAESVRFAQSQVDEQLAANVHPEAIGRGIAQQIGLACRISPAVAQRRLSTARALWLSCPTPTAGWSAESCTSASLKPW
jgi:hypothetical protein